VSGELIVWALFAPLIAGLVAVLILLPLPGNGQPARPLPGLLYGVALVVACGGPVAQVAFLQISSGSVELPGLGASLAVSPLARLGTVIAGVALLCGLLISWPVWKDGEAGSRAGSAPARIMASMLVSFLLAGALLATDRLLQILCLLAAALPVAALAALPVHGSAAVQTGDAAEREQQWLTAKRLAGGLKQVALASLGTVLLVGGALMLASYPFNMERAGMLQAGLGLLCVGLAVRVGIMPFGGGAPDLIEAAPQAAIVTLGAIAPSVLIAGLEMLGRAGPNLAPNLQVAEPALLIPAVGALLAGLRALAALPGLRPTMDARLSLLLSASVGLQMAWALFGVVSGSRQGTVGAALLAANLALTVPLMLARPSRRMAMAGAASLLGLPPLGGFPGALLVAQAATNVGGFWLSLLLLGSVLAAGAWLGWAPAAIRLEGDGPSTPWLLKVLAWVLLAAQLALAALALPLYGWLLQ
jgi:formate hydrogenlyase subunit 3/multisubunit Na+/H+ antiporter MnhD subunit